MDEIADLRATLARSDAETDRLQVKNNRLSDQNSRLSDHVDRLERYEGAVIEALKAYPKNGCIAFSPT